jgi:hypothetical protein
MSDDVAMRAPSAKERLERSQHAFAASLQGFIKRWAPKDSYDRADFERDAYFLIQHAQTIAQEPLLAQWSAMLAAMPMPPFIVPKAKGEP